MPSYHECALSQNEKPHDQIAQLRDTAHLRMKVNIAPCHNRATSILVKRRDIFVEVSFLELSRCGMYDDHYMRGATIGRMHRLE